jgi:hypothetical protein
MMAQQMLAQQMLGQQARRNLSAAVNDLLILCFPSVWYLGFALQESIQPQFERSSSTFAFLVFRFRADSCRKHVQKSCSSFVSLPCFRALADDNEHCMRCACAFY